MTITITTKVTVYSRPGCVQCTATYRALDRKGITYKPVDVDQTPGADELLRELGYLQLPVVIVTGTWDGWCGFRPDCIDAL
jgi:glutaredoxin-like protein NrdH